MFDVPIDIKTNQDNNNGDDNRVEGTHQRSYFLPVLTEQVAG